MRRVYHELRVLLLELLQPLGIVAFHSVVSGLDHSRLADSRLSSELAEILEKLPVALSDTDPDSREERASDSEPQESRSVLDNQWP